MADIGQSGSAISRWRTAGENGDAAAAAGCLSTDVELISPLTARFAFHGRAQVQALLTAAFTVISEISYHTELGDGDTCALFYSARIGQQELEEAQLLHLDAAGLIRKVTLWGRPLPALTALTSALGPELARQQGRPAVAALIRASAAPLHAMAKTGDRRIVPLADPNRH